MLVLPLPLLLLVWPVSLALAQTSSSISSGSLSASLSSGLSSAVNPSASSAPSSSATAISSTAFPDLGGFSVCVNNCLVLSISQVGCNSIVDVDCFCPSPNATLFENAIVGCVTSQCPGDLASAENVSQLFCNVASPSVSLSFSPLPSSTSSSSGVSSSPSSSSSASSTAPISTTASSSSTPSQTGNTNPSSGAGMTFQQLSYLNIAVSLGLALAALETIIRA